MRLDSVKLLLAEDRLATFEFSKVLEDELTKGSLSLIWRLVGLNKRLCFGFKKPK